MLIRDLIKKLQELPDTTEVYAWHDGDVHELHTGEDTLDYDGKTVQINIKNSHDYT